jgi:hypothetical protein
MGITRRRFIIGAAAASASLIVPSFAKLAIQHIEKTGAPLMEPVPKPLVILRPTVPYEPYVFQDIAVAAEPPEQITWRSLFEKMDIAEEDGLEGWLLDPSQLDRQADEEVVLEWWGTCEAPWVHAYEHLRAYENELVTEFEWDEENGDNLWGGQYTSTIEFIDAGGIRGDYFAVEASDDMALSMLQHQLNRLGAGIRIESPT